MAQVAGPSSSQGDAGATASNGTSVTTGDAASASNGTSVTTGDAGSASTAPSVTPGAEAPPRLIHLMFCLRRAPHLTRAEFQAYWRDVHGPLVRAQAEALGLARYEQNHALPDEAIGRMATDRGSPPGFDGVAQLWWAPRTLDAAQKAAARAANALLLEDERRFIDLAASPIFLVEDHPVIGEFVASRLR